MSDSEYEKSHRDNTESETSSIAAATKEIGQTAQRFLGLIHSAIELCGKHPFATGLFAILGIIGLAVSIVGYKKDREEAVQTTDQVAGVSEQIEKLEGKIGKAYREGIFLYEEKVEIYWNDWWGHPHRSDYEIQKYGQAELTVRGEGKTVDFTGTLSMNCSNAKYFWKGLRTFMIRFLRKKKSWSWCQSK